MLTASIFVIFPFCMLFAAISDVLSMTIANRVSVILIAAFAVIAPMTGMDWATYGWHFVAGLTVLAVTFAVFAIGGMGGGDAKLMTATAVWMGFNIVLLQYLVLGAMLGGLMTVLIVLFRNSPMAVFTSGNIFLRHFADQKAGIPYGVALGIAGLMIYPQTDLVRWALDFIAAN